MYTLRVLISREKKKKEMKKKKRKKGKIESVGLTSEVRRNTILPPPPFHFERVFLKS